MQTWIIGSAAGCNLVVDSSVVSARHCRLTQTADAYVLEDLGSTNGTYVNSERITSSRQVSMQDSITLGLNVRMPWPQAASSQNTVVLRIGREPDNDYVVDLPTVSGHHARIIWNGDSGSALIEDLGSSNGTALGSPHQKITRSSLKSSDTIYLGSHAILASQIFARLDPSPTPGLTFRGYSMLIGADPACDRVVDLPMVSRRHARLVRRGDQIWIKDLGSLNGTFVNGQRIDRETAVRPGDLIGLGSHALTLDVAAPRDSNTSVEEAPGAPRAEPVKEAARVQRVDQPADEPIPSPAAGPWFPVIRLQRRLFRFDVSALYENHLVWGSRRGFTVPITEELCHPSGEPGLALLLSGGRHMDFADVELVQEETAKKPRKWWIFYLTTSPSRMTRFTIHPRHGRRVRLTMAASQSASVRAALLARLGDRYQVRHLVRAERRLPREIVFLGFLISIGARWAYGTGGWAPGLPIAALALLVLFWGFWYIFAPRGPWRSVDPEWPDGPTETPTQILKKRKKRNPIRSMWLGWTLKIAGIGYYLWAAGPLAHPVENAVKQSKLGSAIAYVTSAALGNPAYQQGSILWVLFYAPSPLLIYYGYRLCQRRYEPAEPSDLRKPILFLRPFEDDARTTLQPSGLVAALAGIRADSTSWFQNAGYVDKPSRGRLTVKSLILNVNPIRLFRMVIDYGVETSEELLVRYFETFGPVIAIGRPGERFSTAGAARMYIDDDHWQEAILTELGRAQAVVIQPGTSAGVHWELDQIRTRVGPYRVLLCLVSYWNDPQAYETLADLLKRIFRVEIPRVVPYLDRPCFLYFEHGWQPRLQELSYKNPIIWPVTGNATDLTYTLHPFLQGMHGGDREFPRLPRWKSGLATQLALVTALLLALVVAYLPAWVMERVADFGGAVITGRRQPRDASADESTNTASAPGAPTPIDSGQPTPDVVAQSARLSLSGRAVPYRFMVPEALVKEATTEPLIEYSGKSPDGRLMVHVIAHDQFEDLSDWGQQRLAEDYGKIVRESKLESVRTVTRAGVDWTDVRIVRTLTSGKRLKEIARATSGPGRTVLVLIQSVGVPDFEPVYDHLAEEILDSFQIRRGD